MNSLKLNFYLRRIATIGAISLLTLALIASLSGIAIAFHYQSTAAAAHQSLTQIKNAIPSGGLILSLHNWAGNGIIAVSLIQIIVLFLGRQFRRSWLTAWISGILLTLSTIGLGWTAMILAWNQLGFWRLKVELSIIESVPVVGTAIRDFLTGGSGINTTTILHFYTIHSYVLSVAAIALSLIHLIALITQEQEAKGLLVQQLEKLIAPTDANVDTKTTSPKAETTSSKV